MITIRMIFRVLVAFCMLQASAAFASHFRGGDINWVVADPVAAPYTVTFTVRQSWRHNSIDCYDLQIVGGTTINTGGCSQKVQIGGGTDAMGDAYFTFEYVATHTFPGPGSYTVRTPSCCRISGLQNGGDDSFQMDTVVLLDGVQKGNPVAVIPPLMTFVAGSVQKLDIPVYDPDGDTLSCRFATNAETGIADSSIPTAGGKQPTLSMSGNICTLTWDLTAATTVTRHVVPIVIEAKDKNGAINTVQLDSIATVSSTVPPTCTGGEQVAIRPGQAYSTTFEGTGTTNLTLSTAGAPTSATFSPALGTSGASPLKTTFSWTPTTADAGKSYAFRVVFTDTNKLEGSCSEVINVSLTNPVVDLSQPADITAGQAPALSGTVQDVAVGQTVQLDITDGKGGSWTVTTTATATGYSTSGPANLPVGDYSVIASLPGTSALPSAAKTFKVTAAPVPAVTLAQPADVPAGQKPALSGTVQNAAANQTVQLDITDGKGGSWTVTTTANAGSYSTDGPANLPAGTYTVVASLPGTSAQPSAAQTFKVTSAPVVVPAVTLDQPANISLGQKPVLKGTVTNVADGETVVLTLTGNTKSAAVQKAVTTWTVNAVVANGTYSTMGPDDLPAGTITAVANVSGAVSVTRSFQVLAATAASAPPVPVNNPIALLLSALSIAALAFMRKKTLR